MKLFFHSGFYWWFVPHHLLRGHTEQGPKQSILGHFTLRLGSYSHEAKIPFIRANRTSVSFILYPGRDSNPHGRIDQGILSPSWLPIPSPRQFGTRVSGPHMSLLFYRLSFGFRSENSFGKEKDRSFWKLAKPQYFYLCYFNVSTMLLNLGEHQKRRPVVRTGFEPVLPLVAFTSQ